MEGAFNLFSSLLLGGARFLPVVTLTPLFGGQMVPVPIRVGVACALGLLSSNISIIQQTAPPLESYAAELFTGFVLAIPVILVLRSLTVVGACLDTVCGTNSVELFFPAGGDRSPVAEHLASMTLTLACFFSGAHMRMVSTVAKSYDTLAVGGWFGLSAGGLKQIIGTFESAFMTGVFLGLPFIAVGLGVEIVIALAGRVAPGVNLSESSMPIKNVMAMAIVVLMYEPLWRFYSGWGLKLDSLVSKLYG